MPESVNTTRTTAERTVHPVRFVRGVYTPPPDKSIAHRALIISALADGACSISPAPIGEDVASTARCLEQLGVAILKEADRWIVQGISGTFRQPEDDLDCGNSGTTMRLLSGLLAGVGITVRLTGDDSLNRRPMKRIVGPLRLMGADIESASEGTAPLTVHPATLHGIEYTQPIPSAQVKSAILLAGLHAKNAVTVVLEPLPSRDHTERMLAAAGAEIAITARKRKSDHRERLLSNDAAEGTPVSPFVRRIALQSASTLKARDWQVPGDVSSAAYFIAAAAGTRKSQLTIRECGLNVTRTGFLKVLKRMGAHLDIQRTDVRDVEPRGNIKVEYSELKGARIAPKEIPLLIDELPLLAVLAAHAKGVTVVRGAAELRHKESDRLRATAENLRRMGAKVGELDDGWAIEGPTEWRAATIDAAGDHRIAMAFSIAALWADGETTIQNSDVVGISNPEFFESLTALTQ